ncbi:ABC transporter substrate-binding protein, partial [Achromobacter sp.]
AMLEAIKIAIAEVNAAGGAAGRQIQLYAEDDQTKPDAAVLAVKKLIEINKAEAVVGIWPSSVGLAAMPITNAAGLITMNTCGAPEMLTENKQGLAWMFQASNAVFGRAFAEVARQRGFKRPAVMAFNNSTFVGQANYFRDAWREKGGDVSAFTVYEPNQTTYRTELNKVLASKPDVISLSAYRPDATIILKEWFQTGQDCKFIMPGWTANEDLVKALGKEATEGIISISNVAAHEHQAYKRFAAEFRKRTKREPDIFASQSYDMVITLALAIEAAGARADVAAINGKIRAVTGAGGGEKVSGFAQGQALLRAGKPVDYDGASSRLDFGKQGETVPDFGVFDIRDGKLVLNEVIAGKV